MLTSVILTLIDSSNEQRFQLLGIFGLVPDLAPPPPPYLFLHKTLDLAYPFKMPSMMPTLSS